MAPPTTGPGSVILLLVQQNCWVPCPSSLISALHAKLLQSCLCPTLCDPMDTGSLLGSPIHGILQARTIEWAALSFSRGSSWPRDPTHISNVSGIGRRVLFISVTWEASISHYSQGNWLNLVRHITTLLNSPKAFHQSVNFPPKFIQWPPLPIIWPLITSLPQLPLFSSLTLLLCWFLYMSSFQLAQVLHLLLLLPGIFFSHACPL